MVEVARIELASLDTARKFLHAYPTDLFHQCQLR